LLLNVAVLNQGWIRIEVVQQLLMLARDKNWSLLLEAAGRQADPAAIREAVGKTERVMVMSFPTEAPIASNRCAIAKHALDIGANYLFMLDDDTFMGGSPLPLLEKDLDVVAMPALCFKPHHLQDGPLRWNISYTTREGQPLREPSEDGLFCKVASIGTGAMLIARRVLEHPDMRAPFRDEFNEDGVRLVSEDFNFCDRARKAGFDVWAALEMPCGHVKELDLKLVKDLISKGAS